MRLVSSSNSRAKHLLDAVLSAWVVDDAGNLTSSEWNISFYEAAFRQSLNYDQRKISEHEFATCVQSSLRDMSKRGLRGIDHFISAFAVVEKEIRSRPLKLHYVGNRCAFASHTPLWIPFEIWNAKAVITNIYPPTLNYSPFFINGLGEIDPSSPNNGLQYLAGPHPSRDIDGALTASTSHASSLFGLLAFASRLSSLSRYIGPPKSLSSVRLGRNFILFDDKFRRNDEHVSYYYTPQPELFWLQEKDIKGLAYASRWASHIGRLDQGRRDYAREFFRLYYNAVSEVDPELQVVWLWKAAEYATFSQGSSTEQIARRLALTFGEYNLVEAISSSMGHWRHMIIHSERHVLREDDTPEFFRYLLEKFVRSCFSKEVKSLDVWRATLEVATTKFDNSTLKSVMPLLERMPARGKVDDKASIFTGDL